MVRLELHRDSMDILKIVLRINETQGRTVQEVIALAEEKDGELFLDTWRLIFELLSLTKDFEKLVDADHWPLTNSIKTLENALQDQHARDANLTPAREVLRRMHHVEVNLAVSIKQSGHHHFQLKHS